MQKGGEGVQIACKVAYVLNGRPHISYIYMVFSFFGGIIGVVGVGMGGGGRSSDTPIWGGGGIGRGGGA